mgnify:CR=1 FL=1
MNPSQAVPDQIPALLEGLATTRTIRRYLDESVPGEVLASIMWHATRAPSGSNRQPVRYVVLRDDPKAVAAKALLGDCFRKGWNDKQANDGWSGTAADTPKARAAATMQHYVDHFEHTPVVVLGEQLKSVSSAWVDNVTGGAMVAVAGWNMAGCSVLWPFSRPST